MMLLWISIAWIISYAISMKALEELVKRDVVFKTQVQATNLPIFYFVSFFLAPPYVIGAIPIWICFFLIFIQVKNYGKAWQFIADAIKNSRNNKNNGQGPAPNFS